LTDRGKDFYPPWSIEGSHFTELCTRCGDCISICPQGVIKKNPHGFPVIDYSIKGCTFCAKCADTCNAGSISLMEYIGSDPWKVKAVITEFCINYQGTVCQMCSQSCHDNAIKFKVRAEGAIPEIDLDECTGCGECFRSCPKRAIDIKSLENT